jgi:hypothetical protein
MTNRQASKKMDKLKFKLVNNLTDRFWRVSIVINKKELAKMISEDERRLLSRGVIDFTEDYAGHPPDDLLEELLLYENPSILGNTCDYGYKVIYAATQETEHTVIWELYNPGRRKKALPIEVFMLPTSFRGDNPANIGLNYSLHFEFNKNQYYKEIRNLVYKMRLNLVPTNSADIRSAIKAKLHIDVPLAYGAEPIVNDIKINSQWIDMTIFEDQFLQRKKHDRKRIRFGW